ncbi:MAG: hypothetical protein AAF441_18095 [Pseudomonadota bacterium]
MLAKTLALLAATAIAGFATKIVADRLNARPVRVKRHPHSDGRVRKLRQDPETGEYYPVD